VTRAKFFTSPDGNLDTRVKLAARTPESQLNSYTTPNGTLPPPPSPAPPPTGGGTVYAQSSAPTGPRVSTDGRSIIDMSGDPTYDAWKASQAPYSSGVQMTGLKTSAQVSPPPPITTTGAPAGMLPFPDINLNFAPQGGGGGGLSAPRYTPGSFADYLAANGMTMLSPEQIAEEAKRLRDMKVNPQRAALERSRQELQEMAALATSQAGEGKDAALRGVDKALQGGLQRAQARAIRNNLVGSNIPETTDFRPLEQEAMAQKSGIEQAIANRVAEIQLRAQQGDQSALDQLTQLEALAGQIETQAVSDLTARERAFGEQARGNRYQEFMGNENLKQNATNMNFRNELDSRQFDESMRQFDTNQELEKAKFEINKWATQQGFNIDTKQLEQSMLNGELDRAMKNYQLTQMQDPNSLANRTAEAELKAILARSAAPAGGTGSNTMSPQEAFKFSEQIGSSMSQIAGAIQNGQITPAAAQGRIDYLRSQYDSVNGSGSFDRVFGSMLPSGQAPTDTPTPSTQTPAFSQNPTVAADQQRKTLARFEQAVAEDRQQAQTLEAQLRTLEAQYAQLSDSPTPNYFGGLLPGGGTLLGSESPKEAARKKIEALQSQIDSIYARVRANVQNINSIMTQTGGGDN
jgi:hypothetical protein